MTQAKPTPNADDSDRTPEQALAAVNSVEGEIREFVRRDVAPARKPPEGELSSTNINYLVERVAGTSIRELDSLIAELTAVRHFLQAEGERVQREIANYTQVSQAAMSSAKVILESMGQWKSAVAPMRDRT